MKGYDTIRVLPTSSLYTRLVRLQWDGIDPTNEPFIVTVDERSQNEVPGSEGLPET